MILQDVVSSVGADSLSFLGESLKCKIGKTDLCPQVVIPEGCSMVLPNFIWGWGGVRIPKDMKPKDDDEYSRQIQSFHSKLFVSLSTDCKGF